MKKIGILGGMGPLATADLFTKITNYTVADCDSDHIRVIIDSNTAIADRTAAILNGGKPPVSEMLSALKNLENCGVDCVIMPCNTAHYFLPELQKETSIPFLNMIEATAKKCLNTFPGKTAAILATSGTLRSGVYGTVLDKESVPYLIPDEEEQAILMHLIYDIVKASKPIASASSEWNRLLSGLKRKGADYFILGCTELPILADNLSETGPFVDPTSELAKAAIRFCGYKVRE